MAKKRSTNLDEVVSTEYELRNKSLNYKVELKCKNTRQKEFLKLLKDHKKEICFGIGAAGSGKSYLSLAYVLQSLKDGNNKFKQAVFVNPTVEAGNMNLGYIKGTLDEKTQPYREADEYTLEKILTVSGNSKPKDILRELNREECLKYEVVNFIRGKSLDNTLLVINEAENFSKEEMLLLLTRIGEDTKVIVTGDPLQKDRKDLKKCKDGLSYAYDVLKDLPEVGAVEFTNDDIVRNPLIQKIIERFE